MTNYGNRPSMVDLDFEGRQSVIDGLPCSDDLRLALTAANQCGWDYGSMSPETRSLLDGVRRKADVDGSQVAEICFTDIPDICFQAPDETSEGFKPIWLDEESS